MIKHFKRFPCLWIATMIFALIGSLCSCEDKEAISRKAAINNAGSQAALDCKLKDGIVIYDKDGNMINCVFKPPEPSRY